MTYIKEIKFDVIIFDGEEIETLLRAAYHGLRSYQYGNRSTELAEEVANEIEKVINLIEVGKLKEKLNETNT